MTDRPEPNDTSPDRDERRDVASPSHQRPPFNDPLPGGDPTAPGAPHEPGGDALRQSEVEIPSTHRADAQDWEVVRPSDEEERT